MKQNAMLAKWSLSIPGAMLSTELR